MPETSFNPKFLFARNISTRQKLYILLDWSSSLHFGVKDPLSYFSMWNIIFFGTSLFTPYSYIPLIRKNMALQCSLGGAYITYIYPKRIKIKYLNNMVLDEMLLSLMDLFAHQSLFFLSAFSIDTCIAPMSSFLDFIIVNIPFLLYYTVFSSFSLYDKYGLHGSDLQILSIIYLLSLFLLSMIE